MKRTIIALLALGAASAAHADIIPNLTVSSPIQVGNLFQYTYTATLAADQALVTGNYFTIFDFQGFAGFGTIGAGFTPATSLLGVTPDTINVLDDPTVLNATFTYAGPTINQPVGNGQGVSTELGAFQIFSVFDGLGFIPFVSEGTKNNGIAVGTPVANIGFTAGPLSGDGTPGVIPEPSVWAMLVIGFGAIGVSVRRRRPTAVAA